MELVPEQWSYHYGGVIMSAMASQITGVSIVCSNVCSSGRISKKTSKLRVTGLCEGNPPVTCVPPQRASNAEKVSIWWYHHVNEKFLNNIFGTFSPLTDCPGKHIGRTNQYFDWLDNLSPASQDGDGGIPDFMLDHFWPCYWALIVAIVGMRADIGYTYLVI